MLVNADSQYPTMLFEESFTASSHVNIRSFHKTTVMVMTENHLTPRGTA
jgi:hypothetical protein